MRRLLAPTLCAVLALGGPAAAQADKPVRDVRRYLAVARRLVENFEYERALQQLERAKEMPGSAETDVLIPLCEGIIHRELRQMDQATAAYKTALLLNPNAQLPWPVSKKVRQHFETVRTEVKKQLPRLQKELDEQPLSDAPLHEESPKAPRDSSVPAAASTDFAHEAQAVESQAGNKPFPVLATVLMGSAAVAAGTGLYLGWRSSVDTASARAEPFQAIAAQHQGSAISQARAANLLYGSALLLAAGAVIVYWVGR
jgi:hypothetical protein